MVTQQILGRAGIDDQPLDGEGVPDDCFVYLREADSERVLVALNFADEERLRRLPDGDCEVMVSTYLDREAPADSRSLPLRAAEGCVLRLRWSTRRGRV